MSSLKKVSSQILDNVNKNDIHKIYSGRPGCACGCKGTYTYGSKGVRKLNNMKLLSKSFELEAMDGGGLNPGYILTVEAQDNRVYTLYLTAEASARLQEALV